MDSLYEKLMNRMSEILTPAASLINPSLKKLQVNKWTFHPFITLSREPGSGGRPIAKKVAELTGFDYYNDKLIEKVARSTHLRAKILKTIDEKSRSGIQDFIHSMFNPDYVSDIKFVRQLANVIMSLSEKGDVVILGHGGNFVTSPDRGFHVRVCAPYPIRVERAIKFEKVSSKKAKDIIKKVDLDRKSFVSQYFSKDVSNANYYDLVINTTYLDIEESAVIILKAFETKFHGYLKHFKLLQKRSAKISQ